MGSSSLRRRTDSPHTVIPTGATPRQASIAHRAGSPPRAAAVAGPSRTSEPAVAGPSRISDTGPHEILVDSAEEIDELDETEADPNEIDQLLDSDPAPAPDLADAADLLAIPVPPASRQHSDTTPPLDTAIARLSSLEPEQHYSASAIAAYLKPVLRELARLRQDARERDAAEAGPAHTESTPPLDTALSCLSNLGNEKHYSVSAIAAYLKPVLQELARLHYVEREHAVAAAEIRRQATAVRTADAHAAAAALARAQEESSAYATRLAEAHAEVAALKEAVQSAEGRIAAGESAHSQARAQATRVAELLVQRAHEVQELRASGLAADARAKTADDELARLRETAALSAWRIDEGGKRVEALQHAAGVQGAALRDAREEIERLKGDAKTAAERREVADDEIECWRAAAAASGERVAVLEAEIARLKAVEERCERAEAAGREARALLGAAQKEIGRLRVENAGLREEATVADVQRLREGTVTPRKPSRVVPPGQGTSRDATSTPTPRRKKDATTLTQHPPRKTPPGQSPARQERAAPPQPPDPAPSVEMLQDIHVDIICATVDGIAVCRFCLGSDPEVITTFERSAIRDIHAHNMQVHRAEYSQFMFDKSQDLLGLRELITREEGD
ncbi:hypothetical protein HYPSUDRAFT_965824 [Hypholoma sublateritium FD-334 SS-4]|uniref:Uncharacterized protein n=1 Tax=Hypholoma sublateritium (strain FD-334 SS-4) TaxID=945553 RepID=A0A0D2NN88_HYPSF|nr:hypothetical protein HYPSUDRAFT_965824 [Hypholoma sublateritium FD-334 SS-4]